MLLFQYRKIKIFKAYLEYLVMKLRSFVCLKVQGVQSLMMWSDVLGQTGDELHSHYPHWSLLLADLYQDLRREVLNYDWILSVVVFVFPRSRECHGVVVVVEILC